MFTVTVENSWLVQFMGSESLMVFLPTRCCNFGIHVNPRRWNGESSVTPWWEQLFALAGLPGLEPRFSQA